MDVLITNNKKNDKDLIFISSTLNNKLIYINLYKNKQTKHNNYYLIFCNVKYNDNKNFNFNTNIELEYSGINIKRLYLNINEVYLDNKDLFIKDKIYLILIVETNIINKEKIINILNNKILNENNLIDIYDERINIFDSNITNLILINSIKYDFWNNKGEV